MDSSQEPESGGRDAGGETESASPDSEFPIPNSEFVIPDSTSAADRVAQFAIRNSQFAISCPFCGSAEAELFSLFGSQLLTTEYYCHTCRTVFETLK